MSTMPLLKRGKPVGIGSTHIKIKYFWINDRVDSRDVSVERTPTEVMVANLLTKPVQGKQFLEEHQMLANWDKSVLHRLYVVHM